MTQEQIIKLSALKGYLKAEARREVKRGADPKEIDWGHQQGVLISAMDALLLSRSIDALQDYIIKEKQQNDKR